MDANVFIQRDPWVTYTFQNHPDLMWVNRSAVEMFAVLAEKKVGKRLKGYGLLHAQVSREYLKIPIENSIRQAG